MANKGTMAIKKIVLIGMLAATITGGKLALMALPNVEIVTLLIIAYTVAFGLGVALPATIIFVTTEMLIFGINTWVLSYFIHWCSLSLVTALLSKIIKEKYVFYAILACVMTACFGVLTTFVDTLFMVSGASQGFFKIFAIMYVRGVPFFATHIIANTVIVGAFILPSAKLLVKLNNTYFGKTAKTFE